VTLYDIVSIWQSFAIVLFGGSWAWSELLLRLCDTLSFGGGGAPPMLFASCERDFKYFNQEIGL